MSWIGRRCSRLSPKDGDVETMYAALKDKHPHLPCIESNEIPARVRPCRPPAAAGDRRHRERGLVHQSKAEVVRWGEPDRRAPGGAHGYDARAAVDARPLHRQRAAHQERHAREAVREHPRLRLHVRGVGAAAGKERRRSRCDSRYAPIQSMTANSDRITPPAGRSFCSPASAAPSSSTTSSSSACSRATSPTRFFRRAIRSSR